MVRKHIIIHKKFYYYIISYRFYYKNKIIQKKNSYFQCIPNIKKKYLIVQFLKTLLFKEVKNSKNVIFLIYFLCYNQKPKKKKLIFNFIFHVENKHFKVIHIFKIIFLLNSLPKEIQFQANSNDRLPSQFIFEMISRFSKWVYKSFPLYNSKPCNKLCQTMNVPKGFKLGRTNKRSNEGSKTAQKIKLKPNRRTRDQ